MLKFTPGIITSDDKMFASLEAAQIHELSLLFLPWMAGPAGAEPIPPTPDDIAIAERAAQRVLAKRDAVLDILTTTKNSRPSARRANGGTKKRKTKLEAATQSQTTTPLAS